MTIQKSYVFETSLGDIEITPFEYDDIPALLTYTYDSDKAYLESIGFDLACFPPREEMRKQVLLQCETYAQNGVFNRAVARLAGKTIAICNFDGRNGHFHILDSTLRSKGLGTLILSGALKLLHEQHYFNMLPIEPKATNVPMNGLMIKLGFTHCGNHFAKTHPIAQLMEITRYEVTPEMIERNFQKYCVPFQKNG